MSRFIPAYWNFCKFSASNCHLQSLAFQAVGWEGAVSFLASMFPLLQLEDTQLVWNAEYNARKQAAMQHIHEQYWPYKIIHLTKSRQLNITNCPYISWYLLAWLMLRNSQRTNSSHNDCTLQRFKENHGVIWLCKMVRKCKTIDFLKTSNLKSKAISPLVAHTLFPSSSHNCIPTHTCMESAFPCGQSQQSDDPFTVWTNYICFFGSSFTIHTSIGL
jgi:hypothetical protein